MKIVTGDIMKSDASIVVYISNGNVAKQLKEEHASIYNWVFPRSSLPAGSIIKTNATPWQGHVIMYAADEYGGIKASDMYECFNALKGYLKDYDIKESDVGITQELYQIIKTKDYIKE